MLKVGKQTAAVPESSFCQICCETISYLPMVDKKGAALPSMQVVRKAGSLVKLLLLYRFSIYICDPVMYLRILSKTIFSGKTHQQSFGSRVINCTRNYLRRYRNLPSIRF